MEDPGVVAGANGEEADNPATYEIKMITIEFFRQSKYKRRNIGML